MTRPHPESKSNDPAMGDAALTATGRTQESAAQKGGRDSAEEIAPDSARSSSTSPAGEIRFDAALPSADPPACDRLLVIGSHAAANGLGDLDRQFADWQVDYCGSFLAGIVDVSRRPARAILARVEGGPTRIGDAVAALREAGGDDTKIVLCCAPPHEPIARAAVAFGADDYLLEPLDRDELYAAVGYRAADRVGLIPVPSSPTASMEELAGLGRAVSSVNCPPKKLLDQLAELIRMALGARGAAVVASGATGESGDAVRKPVLTAALRGGDKVYGQLLIGEGLQGAYTFADAQKLDHYATIFGELLMLSSRQREWRRAAMTDECSGLPNRRYLRDRLEGILRQAVAERFQVTLLLFDVDDFKAYNDRFGHDAGDEIIRTVGQLFRKSCREQDVVVRYGGDEFCVVFWDAAGPREAGSKHVDEALVVLDRFRGALKSHRFDSMGPDQSDEAEANTPTTITISGGLAAFPWDGTTPEALLSQADKALLAAKRAGKNRVFTVGEPQGA